VAVVAVALTVACAGAALAQTGASQKSAIMSSGYLPVTYPQVLAHPDDPEINIRWARTQIDRGDLKGASATLERMLLLNPNQPAVRALYGVVLFRLGSYVEAGDQFHLLDKVDMSPDSRREIDEYLAQIERKLRSTHYWAIGSIGAEYDTNRNLSPVSATLSAPILPPTLFAGPAVADWGLIAVGALGMEQDIGQQGRLQWTADGTIFEDDQARVKELDLTAALARTGLIWHTDFADIAPNLVASAIWLGSGQQFYYQALGADISATRTLAVLDRRVTVFADVEALDEIFHTVAIDPTASQSSGAHYQLEAGAHYRVGNGVTLTAAWQGTIKDAQIPGLAYDGNNFILAGQWVFAPGQFFDTAIQYGVFPYLGVDPAVDPIHTRRDNLFDARLGYGIGLDHLLSGVGDASQFAGFTLSIAVEEIRDQSTVANFTNNDFRVLTLLTKRLDF
jgi:hypothetical protein